MSRVVVVGGGIAGLSIARELRRRGEDPLVLEGTTRCGGYLRSERLDGGGLFEHGPQGFLGERPGVLDLVAELGLQDELAPAAGAANKRYLLHAGRLVPLPTSPPGLLVSPLLTIGGKIRLCLEPWARPAGEGPESVRAFAARRIGPEAADVLVDAAVTGIFAGDPAALSLDACFPKMRRMEREHGSLFRAMRARKKQGAGPMGQRLHSFRGGMETLARAFTSELDGCVRTEARVTALERRDGAWRLTIGDAGHLDADSVVLAIPARHAVRLVERLSPDLAARLGEIPTAPVAVVGALFRREAVGHPLDGYGYLAPGGTSPVLGCLFESSVFPDRAPEGKVLLRVLVGGARNPGAATGPENEIVASSLDTLRPLLGLEGLPETTRCVVHRHAIPQYDLAHPDRLVRIEAARRELRGLHLAGASYRGVAVNRLVAEGSQRANEVAAT